MGNPKATKTAKKAAPRPKREPVPKQRLQRLTAEALGTVVLPEDELDIPELGGSVLLRGFSLRRSKLCRKYATSVNEAGEEDFDNDRWELLHVFFGMIDPDLTCGDPEERSHTHDDNCFAQVEALENQANNVSRRIALGVFALNMGGSVDAISKGYGQITNTDSSST